MYIAHIAMIKIFYILCSPNLYVKINAVLQNELALASLIYNKNGLVVAKCLPLISWHAPCWIASILLKIYPTVSWVLITAVKSHSEHCDQLFKLPPFLSVLWSEFVWAGSLFMRSYLLFVFCHLDLAEVTACMNTIEKSFLAYLFKSLVDFILTYTEVVG